MKNISIKGRVLFFLSLISILTLGFYIRYFPQEKGQYKFQTDSAFHFKMIKATLVNGAVPEIDASFVQTPMRNPVKMYPDNLYKIAAFLYSLTHKFFELSVEDFLYIFSAFLGTILILLLVVLSLSIKNNRGIALLVGLLFAVATPAVIRSAWFFFRFESLSLILLGISIFLIEKNSQTKNKKERVIYGILFFLVVFIGTGTWRLLPFFIATSIFCYLLWCFLNNLPPSSRNLCISSSVGAIISYFTYDFYLKGNFKSTIFLFPLIIIPIIDIIFANSSFRKTYFNISKRKKLFLFCLISIVSLIILYFLPVFRIRASLLFSTNPIPITTSTIYSQLVDELQPFPLMSILSLRFFFYLPVIYCFLVLMWIFRHNWKPRFELIAFISIITFIEMFFFRRFILFFYFFFCIHFIHVLYETINSALIDIKFVKEKSISIISIFILTLPALLGYTLKDFSLLKQSLQMDSGRLKTIHWIRTHTSGNDTVIAPWDIGYELETYTKCRVVMDGYLESDINRSRILFFLRSLFSENESQLAVFYRRFSAKYLILNMAAFPILCKKLNLPYNKFFKSEKQGDKTKITILPEGRKITFVKEYFFPVSSMFFSPLAKFGNYVILKEKQEH